MDEGNANPWVCQLRWPLSSGTRTGPGSWVGFCCVQSPSHVIEVVFFIESVNPSSEFLVRSSPSSVGGALGWLTLVVLSTVKVEVTIGIRIPER